MKQKYYTLKAPQRNTATQGQVDNYVMGALAFMPSIDDEQLISMIMLYYCMFYDEAKSKVTLALSNIGGRY